MTQYAVLTAMETISLMCKVSGQLQYTHICICKVLLDTLPQPRSADSTVQLWERLFGSAVDW